MDDVRNAVENALKELIKSKPYKSVTVMEICEEAHLSRKSFYTYYDSKDDVLSTIIKRDITQPIERIGALFSNAQRKSMYELMYAKVYEQIYENPEFYTNLVKPMRGKDDTFIRIVTTAIYDLNIEILMRQSFDGDYRKADYVSYFFASSQAMLIQKWVSDGMPYSPSELAQLYDEMTQRFWLNSFPGEK